MTDRETYTVNKPRVEIEYCTHCGFLLRAAWIARELLSSFP
jgi:selenoprotein W-related protein